MDNTYKEIRHPKLAELDIHTCYLCGEKLDTDTDPDHIIPQHFFDRGDPYLPKLKVHSKCNKKKSKDDQWFVKQLQLTTAYDPQIYEKFSSFLDKAKEEVKDAYIVGKRPRHLVLAKSIFEKGDWGIEIIHDGKNYAQFRPAPQNTRRFYAYLEDMCRGLFIRNIPSSNPNKPELLPVQYENLKIKGKIDGFIDSIRNLADSSTTSIFGQSWEDRVIYFGSRVVESSNKGYLYIEFHKQFGVLATFK